MKITSFELHNCSELLQIIRNTTLQGDAKIKPFEKSDVYIQKENVKNLFPTQKFVLQEQLLRIKFLYEYFLQYSIDISGLNGFIVYNTDEGKTPYVLTPPIIEIIENQPLVIDGQHRTKFFGDKGVGLNCVCINNIAPEYFPYQLPNTNGWNDVQMFDTKLPQGFNRKNLRYKDPDTKRFMFRNYPFPGILKIEREHTGKSY